MKLKNVLKVMPGVCIIDIKEKVKWQKEPISIYVGELEELPYRMLKEYSESHVELIGHGKINILVDSEKRSEEKQGIILIIEVKENEYK